MPEYGGNILCEQGFKNVIEHDNIVGFQVRVFISYYRGVPFCLIGGFDVEVDGIKYGPELISFSTDGINYYDLEDLGTHLDDVWEYGTKAYLHVKKEGGLSRGKHTITVTERVDVPYLPFTTENSQTKQLTLVV